MKVLMIAPYSGGIDVYVKCLSQKLRTKGILVEIAGSKKGEEAYDSKVGKWKTSAEVKKMVKQIVDRICFANYDLVAFHYGKNDVEQYIPVVLDKKDIKPKKTVYFVHFLSRNLFDQYLKDPKTRTVVEDYAGNYFDGYIFFGNYDKLFMEKTYKKKFNGIINFLPETHSHEKIKNSQKTVSQFILRASRNSDPLVILPGFPAHYKDHNLLLSSFEYIKKPMTFIFAGQGWRKKLGFIRKKIKKVNILVVDKYLTTAEFKVLVENSLFGVFPYRQPDTKGEYFQGSGALPNFIYAGKPCIVLNEGAMAEYVGTAGIVVNSPSPQKFAQAINILLNPIKRNRFAKKARLRASKFSLELHTTKCLKFFENLI